MLRLGVRTMGTKTHGLDSGFGGYFYLFIYLFLIFKWAVADVCNEH